MKHLKLFSWPHEMICNGKEAYGRGQASCMVHQEWLTWVYHHLSSDAGILDAAPPVAMGAELGSMWSPTFTHKE